jgi:uncharacterized surface protein with fasciclin (FAS1) repeats
VDYGTNLYSVISANGNLTSLSSLMVAANLTGYNITSNTTVFAPSDDALTVALFDLSLSENDLAGNTSLLTTILEYHVVPGINYAPQDFMDGDSFETLEGENVTVVIANITNSTYHATVIVGATNGTLQGHPIKAKDVTVNILNGLLIPESLAYLLPTATMPPPSPANVSTNTTPSPPPSSAVSFRTAPWALLAAFLMGLLML